MSRNVSWEIVVETKEENNAMFKASNMIADVLDNVLGYVEINIIGIDSKSDMITFETSSYHDNDNVMKTLQLFTHANKNIKATVMYLSDVDDCPQKAVVEDGNVTYYEAQITYVVQKTVCFEET